MGSFIISLCGLARYQLYQGEGRIALQAQAQAPLVAMAMHPCISTCIVGHVAQHMAQHDLPQHMAKHLVATINHDQGARGEEENKRDIENFSPEDLFLDISL